MLLRSCGAHAAVMTPLLSSRRAGARVAVAGAAALFAPMACSATGLGESRAQKSLHQHAQNAAVVMEKEQALISHGDTRAADMARAVVGTGADDTITVLAATGTAFYGRVILHIHVDEPAQSEFDSATHADGCFRYTFRDLTTVPKSISCPSTAPITLPPSAPTTSTTERGQNQPGWLPPPDGGG